MARNDTPLYSEHADWVTAAVLNANASYAAFDCRILASVFLEFIMDEDTAPAGTLFAEWSMDKVTWYPFALDTGKFSVVDPGAKFTVTEAEGKVVVAALAAESRFAFGVEEPPPFLRYRWVSGSGGIATGASAKAFGHRQPG